MMHGIMDTSHPFVSHFGEKAPAIVLAHLGYDVWLGNARGSDYAHEHAWLDEEKDSN